MEQSKDEQSVQSAVARAEDLIERAGFRIGLFAGLAGQRMQSAPTSLRTAFTRMRSQNGLRVVNREAAQPDRPTTERAVEADRPTPEKAEVLIDRLGQRLNRVASLGSLYVLKATAYIREEAEDIWAEAQSIRRDNIENPQ
ncbi:MAG TPA: hypothetical protein VF043_36655 [Ktedonobacteraceae bacterium]